jgi:hypothetical protein
LVLVVLFEFVTFFSIFKLKQSKEI